MVFGFPGYQLPEDPMPAHVKSGFTGEKNTSVPIAVCPCPSDPGEDMPAWGWGRCLVRATEPLILGVLTTYCTSPSLCLFGNLTVTNPTSFNVENVGRNRKKLHEKLR